MPLVMKPFRVEERRVRSEDGTDLAYRVVGTGPCVLLVNGLGGSWRAWSHQIAYLSDRYRFISWDYRGLHRSGPPADPRALRVADHVEDALRVLDAEGVERTAVLGWSLGVQVGLEVFRRIPSQVASLVLINGCAGRPWHSGLSLRAAERAVPALLRLLRRAPVVAELLVQRVANWPETITWARRVGLVSSTVDEGLWHELAGSLADIDMDVYAHMLDLMGDHDASDVLAEIDVPTLVIAGDRDIFTPRPVAERMVRAIPGAELMTVPGGTHFVLAELPELVNLRIEKFFRERGYAPAPAAVA